ncbi:hypothetical protein FFI94_032195 [Rhodococcus sp. KBS0724]|uniref:hypothetical protein n=1 Tax=Rhodococcus sp. KBS0724 TaxID=1179674 RepID=UPI00110F0CD5|nr:hypothetical protein [Rhodococcus sp. KBS0724]TSD40335.1 hypothetical protein FFI94_031845 [Rhodococcus sp. KBS0724]TSD40383.1 hypothetical protein FFI94_032195 [Rhodococcus sp. KBS0724]
MASSVSSSAIRRRAAASSSALDRAQPRPLTGIDELLDTPVVDGLFGDIETCGDLGDRAS